jgi:hypothetical protein
MILKSEPNCAKRSGIALYGEVSGRWVRQFPPSRSINAAAGCVRADSIGANGSDVPRKDFI